MIPYRGSWLDFEFDPKDIINVRIDRRRKIPCSTFLMGLYSEETEKYIADCIAKNITPERSKIYGMTKEEMLNFFYDSQEYISSSKGWITEFVPEKFKNIKLKYDLVNADDGKIIASIDDKFTPRFLKKLTDNGLKNVLLKDEDLIDNYLAEDLINLSTGEVLYEAGDRIDEELLSTIKNYNISAIKVLIVDSNNSGPWMLNTIQNDKNFSRERSIS